MFSDTDPAGEATCWEPKVVAVGEAECDGGVGRVFGDAAEDCGRPDCRGGGRGERLIPGSSLGAMLEFDRRAWCLFNMAR